MYSRSAGVGPYYQRGHGVGPYYSSAAEPQRRAGQAWLQSNFAGGAWTQRRRRRGGFNFKELAKKAWGAVKSTMLPLIQRNGKTFLDVAYQHAKGLTPQLLHAYTTEGPRGVKDVFLDSLPQLGQAFVRQVATRGAGEATDVVGTILGLAKPLMGAWTTMLPGVFRGAGGTPPGPFGNSATDESAIFPFQCGLDMCYRQCISSLPKTQRGGFLTALVPLLASAVGSLISTIPKFVEMSRGSGDVASLYTFPDGFVPARQQVTSRAGATHASLVSLDFGDGHLLQASTKKVVGWEKWTLKRENGGRGRPQQKVVYVEPNSFL